MTAHGGGKAAGGKPPALPGALAYTVERVAHAARLTQTALEDTRQAALLGKWAGALASALIAEGATRLALTATQAMGPGWEAAQLLTLQARDSAKAARIAVEGKGIHGDAVLICAGAELDATTALAGTMRTALAHLISGSGDSMIGRDLAPGRAARVRNS